MRLPLCEKKHKTPFVGEGIILEEWWRWWGDFKVCDNEEDDNDDTADNDSGVHND